MARLTPSGLSAKRTMSGHLRNVRKPWTVNEKSDNMVVGRENGQIAVAHVGYARVSTLDQDPALQLDALAVAGCAKVFEDRASGARADRPGLRKALDYVRDGDVLIVWKLDRLGRSLPHLIETVAALERRGVGFRSVTRQSTPPPPAGGWCSISLGRLGNSNATSSENGLALASRPLPREDARAVASRSST